MVNRVVRVVVPVALVCPRCARGAPRRPGSAQVHAGLRPLPGGGAAALRRAQVVAPWLRPGALTGRASSTRWTASAIATTSRRGRPRRSPTPPTRPAAAGAAGAGRARRSAAASSPRPIRPTAPIALSSTKGSQLYLRRSRREGGDRHHRPTAARERRIKYGTASWVYGEELEQRTAMWWSPDSRKLAYYRFDEQQVRDYYLRSIRRSSRATLDTEAYPKAGAPNPIVDLFVYDVATKKTTTVDVRDGKPFDNDVVGHYVYHVAWSPDGTRAAVQPHQPPAERHGVRGREPGDRRVPRRPARGVADRLGRERAARCSSSRTASASSGNRSATAGTTSISTI